MSYYKIIIKSSSITFQLDYMYAECIVDFLQYFKQLFLFNSRKVIISAVNNNIEMDEVKTIACVLDA